MYSKFLDEAQTEFTRKHTAANYEYSNEKQVMETKIRENKSWKEDLLNEEMAIQPQSHRNRNSLTSTKIKPDSHPVMTQEFSTDACVKPGKSLVISLHGDYLFDRRTASFSLPIVRAEMDTAKKPSFRVLFRELSSSGAWLLYFSRIVLFSGLCAMMPYLQTELTDYFVGRHTADPDDFDCTGEAHRRHGHADDDTPQVCIDAHNDVLMWTTGRTLFTAFTLSLILNPAVGTWSDMYGRKPFLVLSTLLHGIAFIAVFLYTQIDFPLYWYYPALVLSAPFSSQTICIAYISDVISSENLIMAFGLLFLAIPLGIVIGMTLVLSGVIGSLTSSTIFGFVICIVSALIQLFFLPEPLSTENMIKARATVAEKAANTDWKSSLSFWWASLTNSLQIVWRTPLFRKLTIMMLITGIFSEEYVDFRVQYLQEMIGFSTTQQSMSLMVMGVSGLLMMTVGLWIIRPVLNLTSKQILILCNSMMTISVILLAVVQAAWMAYLSLGLLTFWMPYAMAISAIKAENVANEEQGAVQGALTAVFNLGQGLGPLIFFSCYYVFRSGSLYIPAAPFYFASALVFTSLLLSMTLDIPLTKSSTKPRTEESTQSEELVPLIPKMTV